MARLAWVAAGMLALAGTTQAQPVAAPGDPQAMADKQRRDYGVTARPDRRCRTQGSATEIVVCVDHGEDQRIPSTADTDPASRAHGRTGALHPPNVSGLPDCTEEKCIRMGWAPPPVYYVDLDTLPPPPEGSEGDKVANGEARDR